tara:strand:- start:25 stop:543 length:519 start_codon:yes stop_codon:yes gene_type:complete
MTSRLLVDKIESKTGTQIDMSTHTLKMPSGSVVQVQHSFPFASFFSSASQTEVDVTDYYVDITPKFSDSIIIWEAAINGNMDSASSYARFRVVDSNNSDAVIHENAYVAQYGYLLSDTDVFGEFPIRAVDTNCGTTNTMRLQLQMKNASSSTFKINWSSSERRLITATEIAQ